jgi:hypothetical protein
MPSGQTFATVTDWGQLLLPQGTNTLAYLPNPLSLDLLQIFTEGGDVIVNVTSAGVVHSPAVSPTGQVLFGRYYTRLQSGSVAAIFADVFSQNNDNQDIIQVRAQGGAGVWHLDYLGVAYSS